MSRINLKNILSAKTEIYALVDSFVRELHAGIHIEDNKQNILFGESVESAAIEEPLQLDGEILGWVKGDDNAKRISALVNLFLQKESERKKLGSEVLMLYQEVNLIFNFSEKLAQSIGQSNIGTIALDEARRLIKSDRGLILLWDERSGQMETIASSGEPIFNPKKLKSSGDLLYAISQSGLSEIMGDLAPLKTAGLILPEVHSLMYAALKVNHRVMGAIILADSEPVQYAAADLKFLITLALQSSSAIESAMLYEKSIREAREREEAMRRVYEVTNKFVPHEFIRSLGKKLITDIQLGDQVEKIVTVLFSDIRGYTTIAEQMTPEENFRFVSSFNERIGPVIRANHGFINQYLGDAIMAIFPEQASDALTAAVQMQKCVQDLNEERAAMNREPIKIGVGMHTGPLIMGITGDHERMDATTIADAVNIASRLESLTKHYKVNILLSEDSMQLVNSAGNFHFRHLGLIQLKGKQAPVSIYECFNGSATEELDRKLAALPHFKLGMFYYLNKSFGEASSRFKRVLEIYPEDTTAKLFLGKANQYLDSGIPENWTGVEEMMVK